MTSWSIFAPRRLTILLSADAMNVSREPMLISACIMSVLPSIGLWLARDAIDAAGAGSGIESLSLSFIPVALLIPAFLIGWVTGFLLIEDRDDGPLLAVDVTPVGKGGFLAYRLIVTVALTAAITVMALQLLLPAAAIWLKLLILVTIPADAALSAVILLALAGNKVEGLALTKLTNIAAVVPLAAIIPSPLRLAAGIVPTYWLGELLGLPGTASIPNWSAAALLIVSHAIVGFMLTRLLQRRVG